MTLTRPTNLSLQDWADQLALDAGVFVRLDNEDWQDWGARVLNANPIFRAAPAPYAFSDWRSWAERLCEVAA